MMKRLWVALVALMVLCTACGETPAAPSDSTTVATTAPTTTAQTTTTTTAQTTTTTQPTPPSTTATTTVSPSTQVTYVGDASGLIATDFELPLRGTTGFASIDTALYDDVQRTTEMATMVPGDAFTVLEATTAAVWRIRLGDGTEGYVDNTYCYLSIADVIPSIVLDNTNSYSSAYLSSGKEIPTITGEALYNAKAYNPRLGREAFLVACNWRMVQKIYTAQQAALAAGYTLVINEAFRPNDVQQQVAAALRALSDADATVKKGINTTPWNISWFIAQRPSSHQKGCAVDTSLARVTEITYRRCGDYRYQEVTGYTPCVMPTPIHELSAAAVSLAKPVSSSHPTAWQSIPPAKSMTEDALKLKEFCTGAGLSPLASEWWHFNDLEAQTIIGDHFTTEAFRLDTCLSEIP